MAELTKQALRVENNTEFPNNNNGQITPSRLRGFNEDMIDSTVNQAQYTADSASFNTRINNVTGSATNTGSLLLTASFDNGTRNLTFTKGDASTFAVNIPDVSGSTINTGSFATTGSNTFVGNQIINGLTTINVGAAAIETQKDFIVVTGSVINTKPYTNVTFGLQDYQSLGDSYKDSFVIDYYDSLSYNFGASWFHNGIRTGTELIVSGSGNSIGGKGYGINQLRTLGTGSFLNQYASVINIGSYAPSTTDYILIGHNALPYLQLSSLNNQITGSTTISGSNGLRLIGNQTITGSVIISSSAAVDLTVVGAMQVTGSTTGVRTVLNNTTLEFKQPNRDLTTAVSDGQIIVYNPTTSELIIGVFDEPNFVNDVELNIRVTSGSGIEFKDWDNGDGAYETWLSIAPNVSSNPDVVFKRSVDISGSLDIQNTLTASLQQGYVWVGDANGRTTTVATSSFGGGGTINTGSFAITGSNTFRGNQTITGSVFISSSGGLGLSNTDGANVQYFGNSFGSNIGVYKVSDATEIGLALDGAAWTTNWGNGPIIYVNNTPGDTYEGVFGFQNKTNYTDGRVTVLKPLDVRGNTTITGSLTISGSAATDLNVIGNSVFTGNTTITGSTPQFTIRGTNGVTTQFPDSLSISSSLYRNLQGSRGIEFLKSGFDYNTFLASYTALSSSFLLNFTDNLSATASYTVGVFDNAFTQDVELSLETTTTNGILFKDIRSDTGAYTTFLKIAPNGGSNPPLEFKRGMQVTGSLSIQSGSAFFANGNRQFNVGTFTSLVSQSGSANVSQSMNFETTDISSGVSIVSNSQITLANSGTYNIQFSAQVLADSGADDVYIWLKKNGTNVAASAGHAVLSNNSEQILSWNYVVDTVANDYYELCWQSTQGDAVLLAEAASGNIPSVPSVILTVTQVR